MPLLINNHFDTDHATAWTPSNEWTYPNTYGTTAVRTFDRKGELFLAEGQPMYGAAAYALHQGNGFGGAGIIQIELDIPAVDADVTIEHSFWTGTTLRREDYFFNIAPGSGVGDGNRWRFGVRDAAGVSTILAYDNGIMWRGKTIRATVYKSDASTAPTVKFKCWDKALKEPAWYYSGVPTYSTGNLTRHRFGVSVLEDPIPVGGYTVGWNYLVLGTIAADTMPTYTVRADGSLKGPLDLYLVKSDGSMG